MALFGTLATCFRTGLAVIHVVISAFGGTCFANLGADATDFGNELRTTAHVGDCGPAHLRAIAIGTNALGHLGHIRLTQARVRAVFTSLGTFNTSFDALGIF